MREAIISFPFLGLTVDPPYCIEIGSFCIYYYGIIIAVGFLLAVLYASRVHKRFDISMDDVYDYIIWGVIAGVICARLYYCITFTDEAGVHTYLRDPAAMLRIRDGGLAIYGGVIGAVLALIVRSRMKKQSVFPILDVMSFGFLIGQLVGRWGNFFNREAYGYETDVFCRMGLTLNGTTIYVHPTFLYESLWNLGVLLFLLWFEKTGKRRFDGHCIALYFLLYGIGRFWIEGLRTDSLYIGSTGIRVSQALSLVLVLGAAALLIAKSRKPFREGDLYVNRVNAPVVILPPESAAEDSGTEEHKEDNEHGGL
jgi:phosphatidylglycerol:prolipoprotein diacylglycerol transferase